MRPEAARATTFCIVTPSYANDFELARQLCASADGCVDPNVEHLLVVPRKDAALFATLCRGRRRVLTKQDVLRGAGMRSLPLPSRLRLPPFVDRRFKEQWWHPSIGRISGWVAQQLIKLSMAQVSDADVLIFADSDVSFIRPLSMQRFLRPGGVALHRKALPDDLPDHQTWHAAARRILGLAPSTRVPSDYVGQLVSWSAPVLRRLTAHIEAVHGRPWPQVVAQEGSVSEYMLYGLYCEEVLGMTAAGHEAWHSDLVHSAWTAQALGTPQTFAQSLADHHVAMLIQSFVPLASGVREQYRQAVQRQVDAA